MPSFPSRTCLTSRLHPRERERNRRASSTARSFVLWNALSSPLSRVPVLFQSTKAVCVQTVQLGNKKPPGSRHLSVPDEVLKGHRLMRPAWAVGVTAALLCVGLLAIYHRAGQVNEKGAHPWRSFCASLIALDSTHSAAALSG
jgi:hypothetical protein